LIAKIIGGFMAKIISPKLGQLIGRLGIDENVAAMPLPNGPVAPKIGGKAGPMVKDAFGTPNDDVGASIDKAAVLPNDIGQPAFRVATVQSPLEVPTMQTPRPPSPAVVNRKYRMTRKK
jgi:hypothetical protein